uniref:Uncharacterized protein n=1 Tax=Anguilla anguilla TaxID=7936 RepID=A0A0E9RT18_ANGAN
MAISTCVMLKIKLFYRYHNTVLDYIMYQKLGMKQVKCPHTKKEVFNIEAGL